MRKILRKYGSLIQILCINFKEIKEIFNFFVTLGFILFSFNYFTLAKTKKNNILRKNMVKIKFDFI